ncbi:dihydrofolate reductase [Paucibacter oligotrophus]|uniref:Dihydrofolate reductase n=1 Tax=Roseateles oligotrophus TaxID=1769250 RepID=A0A840L6X3_9BURK|nr:dihydrofolate reductase [Roseateles oligotrophus]MBB4844324.1 dihydrofolate reductase [Roseateles oligotrophus]
MSTPLTQPQISLVAGVASNRAIGLNNELLWRLPADMARFKALTLGAPVIMGRKTWDSLPARFRPLPGRRNLVLSRQSGLQLAGAECFTTLESALAACADAPRVSVIGGAEIYALALPFAQRLELTEVMADYAADSFFPAWPREQFSEISREAHSSPEGLRFDFVSYQRR